MSTRTRSPGLRSAPASSANSRRSRVGGTPAFSWCPRAGLFARLAARASTKPICTASYPSLSAVFRWTTTHGPASMTVTGVTVPSSEKTWVIPIFLPISPWIISASLLRRPERLDLDVHPRGEIELHQRIHRLRRRLQDVEEPLVRADLE